MSYTSFQIILVFLDRSLITNCSVYLCINSCNADSYKAVTVAIFSERRRNRVAAHKIIKIRYAS